MKDHVNRSTVTLGKGETWGHLVHGPKVNWHNWPRYDPMEFHAQRPHLFLSTYQRLLSRRDNMSESVFHHLLLFAIFIQCLLMHFMTHARLALKKRTLWRVAKRVVFFSFLFVQCYVYALSDKPVVIIWWCFCCNICIWGVPHFFEPLCVRF